MKHLILAPALPTEFKIATIPELALTKTNLLKSTAITVLLDDRERDEAIRGASLIATHLKAFESEREAVKAPFWKICQDIDATARAHKAELISEKDRLDRLVGAFEQERERKAQQARDELAAKAREIEAEAERKRNEALAAAADVEQSNAPAISALEADLDAENAEEEAAARQRQLEDEQMRLAEAQRAQAAKGGARRTTYDVEVTDIKALYAAHPLCVRMEPDLVMIKGLHARGVVLPGVKITETQKFSARG